MKLPNKLTITRIVLAVVVIIILLLPFDALGLNLPKLFVNELIVVDVKYLIAGAIFVLIAIIHLLDGYITKKKNKETDLGKILDSIAYKMLINPCLIILASTGFITPIIPVVLVARDIIVDSLRIYASKSGEIIVSSKLGKSKTICLMIGIILTLFYNIPFELINIKCSEILLIVATILSVVSAADYYNKVKKIITKMPNLHSNFDQNDKTA